MSQYLSTGKSSEFFFSSRSTFASNFGAPGQPSPATSGVSGQPSPATSALPVNLRRQLRRSRSNFASNFGAPGEPSPRSRLGPDGFQFPCAPRHLLGSHEQSSTCPVAPSGVLYFLIGQFSTRSACILPFFCDTSNEELNTLPSLKSVVRRNLHAMCPISPKCQVHHLRLRWSPLLVKCADRTTICPHLCLQAHLLPAWRHIVLR